MRHWDRPAVEAPVVEPKSRFEYSSGGVVWDGKNLLMVKVENLEGKLAWTFPKGHIEKGEKARDAALREVEEETGYLCEIVKPFDKVQYWFKRDSQLIKKTVTWFLMKPIKKTGTHDTEEILEARWVPFEEAKHLVQYKSDKQLLAKLTHEPSFPRKRESRAGSPADDRGG